MSEPNEPPKPVVKELTGRIGKYEIKASIGKGAMGQVYRAHDTVLDRDVALKVLAAHHPQKIFQKYICSGSALV